MNIDSKELNSVDIKLSQQNAIYAALAGAIWSVPILAFWYAIFQGFSTFAPVMQ